MAEINEAKVKAGLKAGKSIPALAAELGVTGSAMASVVYRLEPEVDSSLKFKPTGANIVKARNAGLRWERIAARTGKSASEVKAIFEEHTGQSANTSYSGRGRRFDGMPEAEKPAATSGNRSGGAAGRKTAGTASRKTAGAKTKTAARKTSTRPRTRRRADRSPS